MLSTLFLDKVVLLTAVLFCGNLESAELSRISSGSCLGVFGGDDLLIGTSPYWNKDSFAISFFISVILSFDRSNLSINLGIDPVGFF